MRALLTVKGRREQGRFAIEGSTLLAEALASARPIEELYATQAAYDTMPLVRELDAEGVPAFILDERSAASISDLDSPPGIVAAVSVRLAGLEAIFGDEGPVLVLADLGDPANAGTLLRSADAFGCTGVVFGSAGIDPYNPKVVRGSMGAVFRLPMAVGAPEAVGEAASRAGFTLVGLSADGSPAGATLGAEPIGLVVGNERHGLGPWAALCGHLWSIPMAGRMESLSAGVAGSIALYETSKNAKKTRICKQSE